jgi:hypothetical protein
MTAEMPFDDPLDENVVGRGGVPRDRYDRAMLVPPGGGPRQPYTAISTLSKQLGNDFAINRWQIRMAVKGTGMSRELSAIAGSSRYDTRIGEQDTARNREEGAILDDVAERGQFLAGAHQKRDWGSAFHRYAEQEDPLGEPPVDMSTDLEAFRRKLRLLGIRILDSEVFVVNEELGAAGSFDYLLFVPWRDLLVIGDSKTGVRKLDQDEIQLFAYASSEIYDRDTDERISFEEKYGIGVDQELAYTVHTAAESGECELWPLDLVSGRESALLASAVHKRNSLVNKAYRKVKPLDAEEIGRDAARMAPASSAGRRRRERSDEGWGLLLVRRGLWCDMPRSPSEHPDAHP